MFSSLISPDCKSYLITDTITCKGSFLLYQFIQPKTILIGLAQNRNHYVTVGKKLGIQLEQIPDFNFIDLLNQLVNDSDISLDTILNQIKQSLSKLSKPTVIVDDVTPLLYFGLDVIKVITFLSELHHIVHDNGGLLVLLSHDDCPGDKDLVLLNNWISHQMETILVGFTEGVNGQLQVKRGSKSIEGKSVVEGLLLYYLTESGVNFFTRGSNNL
ncbi:hypothetical protein BC833DRAFT_526492 [Globomyces pollinis-pini]|nr:hypothetical protein BC833DRAFT_526492 [Globomyces pollinis-pini]